MARRREKKQQDKEEFLDQNPELARFTTRIEVVEADFPAPINQVQIQFIEEDCEEPTAYVAQTTLDGEPTYSRTLIDDFTHDLTLANGVETGVGFLGTPKGNPGPAPAFDETFILNQLSLSEDGFGVAQGDMKDGPYGLFPGDMPMGNDYALDGDETMSFSAYGGPRDDIGLRTPEDFEPGATEFGIDYTVLSGRGTVEIVLLDYNGEEEGPRVIEGSSSSLRHTGDGHLSVEMPDGTFEAAYINVTGNLEIAVVGIDVTTNHDLFHTT